MALVIHQGAYATLPTRHVLRSTGLESTQFGISIPVVQRTDRFISLQCKCKHRLRKLLRISSFKGSHQNEESSSRAVGSKYFKKSVKLSYVQEGSEETLNQLSTDRNASVLSSSASDQTTERSQAIQSLFRNWLTLLRTPSPNQVVDEALEKPSSRELSETQNGMQKNERRDILRAVWCSFMGLDAMIKIPLLIFIPSFLAINIIYGAEVSKELTPLWVLGPLVISLYVKLFRTICALYVFTFKQTVMVVKSIPTYYQLVSGYIVSGKLKVAVLSVVDIRNLDYKELSRRKMKDFYGWLEEKYLDFIESIWPTYCRTIRFLKRANLI